jgi:serine phosphatase RsbU (regulator of sigma subunit)
MNAMDGIAERVSQALTKEEARAEQLANTARLILLLILSIVALLNAGAVNVAANMMNFGALAAGICYGLIVFLLIRRAGYRPIMKYVTSCLDVMLVFLLLFMYTRIEVPSVALKNYVFLIVFPLIGLTAFRYDRTLTWVAGGLAIALYLGMMFFLQHSKSITITGGGYERELFSTDITYVGQATKVLILCGYITLVAHLAKYSRSLFVKLVGDELQLRGQQELMEWELGIASDVQTRFLPHSFPEIPGLDVYGTVQQGKFVGGDYCDVLKLGDDVLLIVVADVSGKGVPAALIMAEVRASTHLLAPMRIGIRNLALRLNTMLCQSTDKKIFVTLFAAEIDTSNRLMTYVNAGHPPPLIYANGEVRSLAKGTLPLGCYPSLPGLTEQSEEFCPGSTLIAYTDGLFEQTNPQGEQYGQERLREYVQAHAHLDVRQFAGQLLDELRTYGQSGALTDDAGLVVAKVSSSSSP